MRKIFLIAAAAGLGLTSLSLIGVAANAGSPSGQFALNGVAGKAGFSSLLLPVKVDSKLYDYCTKVINDVKRGRSARSSSSFTASDCIEIFVGASIPDGMTPAQSGQAGKGGDGGGVAGLPGGKGGAAGGTPGSSGGGQPASAKAEIDEELLDYCGAVLKESRPGSTAQKPVESDDYEVSDCVDYFASLDTSGGKGASGGGGTGSAARSGADGASISGGQGGEGGKKGGGPGGASGGAGGVGVGGGTGGKGGAGGGGY